jgi:glycosyltransferase involved in cell wall biosynthesis
LKNNLPHVLVIPDLFPLNKDDLRGIFILDYLDSIKWNFKVTIFSSRLVSPKTGYYVEQSESIQVHRFAFLKTMKLKALKPIFYLIWFYKSFSIIKKFKDIDLVHSHGSLLSGTLGWLYSKNKNIPLIITEHQNPFSTISNNFLMLVWAKYILQKADLVLTVSNHLKNEILSSGINPRKIIVTYNPVNTDIFNSTNRTTLKKTTFVFAGRLDTYKGAVRCINAFNLVIEKYNNVEFIIIGEGEEFVIIQDMLRLNKKLNDKIILKGYLKKDEMAGIFKSANFFIFPSLHESFGLVIAEAMACGLPVIAPNITAPPEYVDSDSGILVNPLDINEISRAIEYMIQNNKKFDREEISRKVISKFSIKEFGNKMQSIYSSVLA